MKQLIKNTIKNTIKRLTHSFSSTKFGGRVNDVIINDVMNRVQEITYQGTRMKFTVPNVLNRFRVDTFLTKEPETLEWLDQLPEACTLWDVGANVGLYSVYAARKKKCRVVAFEPSVFNLELLARNLFLNGLQEHVTIIPLALNDELRPSLMRMISTDWGGALSTFDKEFGWDGKPIRPVFAFQTLGLSMDQVVSVIQMPLPDFIKMDVDGIEHCILQNAPKVLNKVQGVLVEINDNFIEQAEKSKDALENAGLTLMGKRRSEIPDGSRFENTYNQIWERK